MEYFPAGESEPAELEPDQRSDILVVPALATGNVGQLAVDLIVSSFQVRKAGYLDDPHVLPCVGNDPFGTINQGELALPLEVYEEDKLNLKIVQQRAPIIKGTMLKFSKNFAHWASDKNVKEVVILSGIDAGKQPMRDIGSAQINYISSATIDGTDERCERLGWKKFEQFSPFEDGWKLLESECSGDRNEDLRYEEIPCTDEMYYPSLPFASLFSSCKAKGLNVLCLLSFCSEGDNIQDAFFLADAFQKLLASEKPKNLAGDEPMKWAIPYSWQTVYGPPPDPSIF